MARPNLRPAGRPTEPATNADTSLWMASTLMALVFGFVALLSFGRGFLADQMVPGLSVYVSAMIALTLAIWALSWIYMRRLRWLEHARGRRGDV